MKRILTLTLAVVLALTLFTGCGSKDSKTENTGGAANDIRVWLASTPETLDPGKNTSMDGSNYSIHLYQGLYRFKYDASGVELGDAKSADVSEDGLTWTFTLRDDIKWTDGQPVTAKDYEYAWKRVCDPATASPYGYDMAGFIKNGVAALDGNAKAEDIGVKAVDDKTLEVVLEAPCAFFDEITAFPSMYPVRQDMVEADPDGWWTDPSTHMSNGPFKMESYTIDQSLVIVPNEDYYDRALIKPTSLTFNFLADENAAHSAFRAGEIDISNQTPPAEVAKLKEEGLLDVRTQLGTYYLSFNTRKAPFDDPNVRKALTLAIDRKFLSEVVLQNTYQPAYSFVGPGFADADPAQEFHEISGEYISSDFEANCELAKQALADAGYPNGEGFPVISYNYNTSSVHQPIGEAIAKTWEEVLGIKTTLNNQEWNTFLDDRRKGNFEVARNGWVADWNDASTMLNLFTSTSGNNDGKYTNPKYDESMKQSNTGDAAAHFQKMHDAEKILMEDWGAAPVLHYTQNFMVSKSLKDWYYTPVGYTLLHTATKTAE